LKRVSFGLIFYIEVFLIRLNYTIGSPKLQDFSLLLGQLIL